MRSLNLPIRTPSLLSSSQLFTGLDPVSSCLSCIGMLSTGHSTPAVSHHSSREGAATCLKLLAVLCLLQPKRLVAARAHCLKGIFPPKGPQVLLCKAAFQLLSPQCALVQGLFLPRCKTLLSFTRMNTLAAIEVPLNSSKTIWCINHSSQFCSSKFSPSEFGDQSKIRCTK